MENSIIWQPRNIHQLGDFEIILDKDFARTMFTSKITSERARTMNLQNSGPLAKRLGFNVLEPLIFCDDTALLKTIGLTGGVYLYLSNWSQISSAGEIVDNLLYETHNVDGTVFQRALLCLFDQYMEYAEALRG